MVKKNQNPEMRLNDLIGNALKELDLAKRHDEKRNYLVEEVSLEISVSSVKSIGGGFEFKIFNFGADGKSNVEKEIAHKVIITLKPKNQISKGEKKIGSNKEKK